jgi:hypothetical protein
MFETLLLIGFFLAGISQMIPEVKSDQTPININRAGSKPRHNPKIHTSGKQRDRSEEIASRKGIISKKQIRASRIQEVG